MNFSYSEKITQLPKYLFAELDRLKKEVAAKGREVISLAIGDPDIPTPAHIISALTQGVADPVNHRYPSYNGLFAFRKAAASWFEERFEVSLDPEEEVLALIGSKEGIFHLPLAFINPGDYVLIPEPAYPVYRSGVIFAGGRPYVMPLLEKNNYLPVLEDIPSSVADRAKIIFLNYPHNPTGAVASEEFLRKLVAFAHQHQLIIAYDNAYSEICFDGYRAPSLLQVPGAKECTIEFHSLSKTYNMTGWRIGFAVGDKDLIAGLGRVKENVDSGIFQAIQYAGIAALEGDKNVVEENINIYQSRRRLLGEELKKLGFKVKLPQATIYLWVPTLANQKSLEFCTKVLREAGVVLTPGVGFGKWGEGYFRIALTVKEEKIKEAMERMKGILVSEKG